MDRSLSAFGAAAALAAAMLTGGCTHAVLRPVFPGPPPQADAVFRTWMAKQCRYGEEGDLERYVRSFGTELTPRFIEAYSAGPSEEAKRTVQTQETARFVEVQKRLSVVRIWTEYARQIAAASADDFGKRAVDDFVRGYRSSALAGLVVANTTAAQAELQRVATEQSEFGDYARDLIAAKGKRKKVKK